LFALDPSIDPRVQHVHGQAAGTQYLVMELTDIEAWAKLLLCACAQFTNLELPNLVTQALSRKGDVSIDFNLYGGLVGGAIDFATLTWPLSLF
jgi:hypothetical protein